MALTIAQKADTLGTFRSIFVRLMEMLAAWVPTSPELEVKTLFGRHIWIMAQHADMIGHRTVELRAKLHYDRPPLHAYRHVLERISAAQPSGDRVAGFYEVLLADLASRLDAYLTATDALLDAPTVDIIHRVLLDFDHMQRARDDVASERPDIVPDRQWVRDVKTSLAACSEIVDHRQALAQ